MAGPIQQRLDATLKQFATELSEIIAALESGGGPAATAAQTVTNSRRRLLYIGPNTLTEQAPPVPVPAVDASTAELLRSVLTYGLKERPYDDTFELIAPTMITNTPQMYDAKKYWDAWTVTPTIDAQISFKGPPNQNTPTTFAGQAINAGIKAQKVWYIAVNAGATGQLYMRGARYVDQGM